jgi:hypothetical protein
MLRFLIPILYIQIKNHIQPLKGKEKQKVRDAKFSDQFENMNETEKCFVNSHSMR